MSALSLTERKDESSPRVGEILPVRRRRTEKIQETGCKDKAFILPFIWHLGWRLEPVGISQSARGKLMRECTVLMATTGECGDFKQQ